MTCPIVCKWRRWRETTAEVKDLDLKYLSLFMETHLSPRERKEIKTFLLEMGDLDLCPYVTAVLPETAGDEIKFEVGIIDPVLWDLCRDEEEDEWKPWTDAYKDWEDDDDAG